MIQAEDGIRDYLVTGVKTCALPILRKEQKSNKENKKKPALSTKEKKAAKNAKKDAKSQRII